MFKLQNNPTFTHAVSVMVPVDGGHDDQKLTVRYRVLPVDQTSQFDLHREADNVAFLCEVVEEITDVTGDDDAPLPWNDALRDRLFNLYYVRVALVNGYLKAVMKARLGN